MDKNLEALILQIKNNLIEKSLTLAVAESCTGGLLSHTLTGISGSSLYFLGGMIVYSNQIKIENLGVREQTILLHGAVSQQTAQEMAENIRIKFHADIGLSTTGIAGPTGGAPTKPVGLVWLGISTIEKTKVFNCHFIGTREQVQDRSVRKILSILINHLTNL